MISISFPRETNNNVYMFGKNKNYQTFSSVDVTDILKKGDKALNENRLNEALDAYTQAKNKNPKEVSTYRKLGKTYFNLKDYDNAEANYKIYLDSNPNEVEALIEYGEIQRQRGMYSSAIKNFELALAIDKNNDLANRSLKEAKNNLLSIYDPQRARKEKYEQATKNLQEALKMTVDYLSPSFMKDLSDVQILFGETASMGGTSNIAQYENYKKSITISNDYIYAAPQVIAAYLTHESIHAKDKDPYTSVHEEQDAYEIATKFWIKYSDGIKDPEMDYAAELYKQSPNALKDRVAEIYTMRDPDINKTSPNHPPSKKFFNFINSSRQNAATQSLKEDSIIA